jgi:hypothetical protein
METHVNTYQGLNKDTAYDSIPANQYIDAKDIRITTTSGESQGAYTNIKGNTLSFSIPTYGTFNGSSWATLDPEVIGHTTIRNRIILLVADNSDTKGWIYVVEYDPATKAINPGFPELKYYNPNFNFKKKWPIEALGRFESNCMQRLYWSDYNNFFRSLNLEDPNITTITAGEIDLFPDVQYYTPLIKVITSGGSLLTGEWQFAYRLITADGKQSLISPPSALTHIVSKSESLIQSAQYVGNITPAGSGKSISIDINTSSYTGFDKIELISIYTGSSTAIPVVKSVETKSINGQSTINFICSGNETEAYVIELLTYTNKNYAFKTPKTMTQKDNSLVIANIKTSSISINELLPQGESFDASTLRYLSDGVTPCSDSFNKELNDDAQWNSTWHSTKQYKFQPAPNNTILGGKGPNISYKFSLEPFTLDASNTPGFVNISNTPDYVLTHNFNDGYGTYTNSTYPNFASPFLSGVMRGYKRGETYRFGIVFYTKKGEATFVEHIGDIKFPDISEPNGVDTVPGTGIKYWPLTLVDATSFAYPVTIGYSMGIEFTIDFSTCPSLALEIESYQIVRVKREEADKRRLTQGVVKSFYNAPTGDTTPKDFDLRISGSQNALHLFPVYPKGNFGSITGTTTNANFLTLGDNNEGNSAIAQFEDYYLKGQYLSMYSPEISYGWDNVRGLTSNVSSNPCLLITGAYSTRTENVVDAGRDLSAKNIGQHDQDIRYHHKLTLPVNFQTIENIKQIVNATTITMEDTSVIDDKVTGLWGSSYLRNYYAIPDYNKNTATLNDPQDGAGTSDRAELYRAGTSVLTQIAKISTDFLTGATITPTAYNSFSYGSSKVIVEDAVTRANASATVQEESFPIVEVVIPRVEVYGGADQNALEANIFIQASPVIDIANTNPTVYGGDTFINMYTLQSSMLEITNTSYYGNNKYHTNSAHTEVYPVESSINIDLDCGATIKRGVKYTFDGLQDTILRQEGNNSQTDYGYDYAMYKYNAVYSVENSDVTFFVKPSNSLDCSVITNDTRAYLSDVKTNGELVDSWTKFGANNFYDIDDYGPINKIVNWQDQVHFIQDRAVGVYAINRAAITTTSDGVPTSLGTGQGFGKHQYYTKEYGSIHQWGIKTTDQGIYFFDALHRKIFMTAGQSAPLSEIKGIHSLLQTLPDQVFLRKEHGGDAPTMGVGVVLGRDAINDEVLFTFLSGNKPTGLLLSYTFPIGSIIWVGQYYYVTSEFTTTEDPTASLILMFQNVTQATQEQLLNGTTLVYDELAQQFSSFYSTTPKTWIENSDILMSPNPLQGKDIYTHNIGNYGEFYGIVEECSISIVINPQADINKILRTIEFNSVVRDANKVVDRTQTITGFRINNQYQDTGVVPYSSGRIKRKFDKWRVKIPRDQNTINKHGRLRSSYFVLTLYFDNSYNKELIMNRVLTYFDYQIF